MARQTGEIVEGKDLMLYRNTGTDVAPTWAAQAAATSHTITYSGETKERVTKDSSGAWSRKKVTKTSAQIKCECLVSVGDTAGYDGLLAAFKAREAVKLKYGFAAEEAGDKYEEGNFVITSLEQTSPAGDDATYSATFDSDGEITTNTKTA